MSVPPWIRTSTRPTPAEVDRLVSAIDPDLVVFAREATAPDLREIAALRPRVRRRDPRPTLMAFTAVAMGAAAVGLLWVEPEVGVMTESGPEPGIYVVSADTELTVIAGVWVRGEGSVEVEDDGRLVLDGDLLLTVTRPVVFEVDDHTFSATHAVVWVDGTGLRIAAGEVAAAGKPLTAGHRWTLPVAARVAPVLVPMDVPPVEGLPDLVVSVPEVVAPQRRIADIAVRVVSEPPPAVTPPEVPVDDGAAMVEAAPPVERAPPVEAPPQVGVSAPVEVRPVPTAAVAWRDVLVRLEQGGSAEDRIAALRDYRATYPDAPFVAEADALSLLIRGTDGDPRKRLQAVEDWLAKNPRAGRTVELHALAARIAREGLHDCVRAEPHDQVVMSQATGAARAKGQAFLGLCAISSGRTKDGQALLAEVDTGLLEPALRQAVAAARTGGAP